MKTGWMVYPNNTFIQSAIGYFVLFAVTLLILLPGLGEPTGVTGKDEFFLSLRTPLTMMEMDKWWIPWLDDAPRLKKPPMVYWLARSSMELFGANLMSARLVTVIFSAFLVVFTALIAKELSTDHRYGFTAALIAMSALSLSAEGRRLMLDLPSATFSAMAFYFFLSWLRRAHWIKPVSGGLLLAAGALTKGPLAMVLFGSGVLAYVVMDREQLARIWKGKWHVVIFALTFLGAALPWFVDAYLSYPNELTSALDEETEARQILQFSAAPVSALLLICFPWSFVLLRALVNARSISKRGSESEAYRLRFLIAWIVISLLPFLFFRSFTRYMAGSLIPMALLCADVLQTQTRSFYKWPLRMGGVMSFLIALFLVSFALWFELSQFESVIVFGIAVVALVLWWQARQPVAVAVSAIGLWAVLLGILYPRLGVNEVSPEFIELVADQPVILYQGPQPAMLSAVKGRAYLRTKKLSKEHFQDRFNGMPLIALEKSDAPELERVLQSLNVKYTQAYEYKTLSARGTWLNFARRGAKKGDWIEAIEKRNLDPLKTTIVLYMPASDK